MTFLDLIRVMLRRWPVMLLGIVLTGGLGYLAISDRGVYTSRTEIVLLAPTSTANPNALKTQSEDIVVTAGVVVKRVTGAGKVSKFNSPEVTLVGIGVRDGWSLRQPDTGGQWGTNFSTQTIVLEIVAPDAATVGEREVEIVSRVKAELDSLQRDAGVEPINYITMTVAPAEPVIYHVGGNKYRTLGMTGLLGAGTTIGIVVLIEYRARRASSARNSVRAVALPMKETKV